MGANRLQAVARGLVVVHGRLAALLQLRRGPGRVDQGVLVLAVPDGVPGLAVLPHRPPYTPVRRPADYFPPLGRCLALHLETMAVTRGSAASTQAGSSPLAMRGTVAPVKSSSLVYAPQNIP